MNNILAISALVLAAAAPGVASAELWIDRNAYAQLRAVEARPADRRLLLSEKALDGGTALEMYSFADLYRLTVTRTLPAAAPGAPSASAGASAPGAQAALAEASPVRPVATTPARGEEARFLVGSRAEPQGWLMALAGLVLAGWVAARRVGAA